MKRSLGTLLAGASLIALAGCGTSSSTTATDSGSRSPTAQPSSPTSSDPYLTVDSTTIALLSQTGGLGRLNSSGIPLDTPADVRAFTAGLSPVLARQVRQAVAKANPEDGSKLVGAVVALGCDVPPGIDVVRGVDAVQIIAQEVASPKAECLAPVTTVAIVALPGA